MGQTKAEYQTNKIVKLWEKHSIQINDGLIDIRSGIAVLAKRSKNKKRIAFSYVTDGTMGWRNTPHIIHDLIEDGWTPVALDLLDVDTIFFSTARQFGGRKLIRERLAKFASVE